MEAQNKEQIINYIEKASVIILSILFILFPVLFTNLTTDLFVLPKQALLVFSVITLAALYAVKTFLSEKVRIARTPFDFPILLFIGAAALSVVFSVARFDSFFNFVPFLFAALSFFAITHNVKNEKSLYALVISLLVGGAITSVLSILSFLKIYVFSFDFSKFQAFSTLGSPLDQTIYLAFLLPLAVYFIYPFVKKGPDSLKNLKGENMIRVLVVSVSSVIILLGTIISIYILMTLQKPVILPVDTGFQVAFAAISQDAARIIQGFLLGSGFGEFFIAFMRFKQAAFNVNPDIWNLTFFRSSSYVLELLATTGLLGIISFLFIVYRAIKEKPLFIPLILFLAAAFVLPFGFYHIVLLFAVLGIYAGAKGLTNSSKYFEVDLQLVASKRGFFVISTEEASERREKYGKPLSTIILTLFAVFCVSFGFLAYDYLWGNILFQRSLVAASQNNGSLTYNYQSGVLNSPTGKYVDSYHRVFSQTNLALANSLALSIPQGSSPSAQTVQTIYQLVQQSINSGRNSTDVSPANSLNWQNLSSVYRALIGFGQNADSFALLTAQRAAQLDPGNPSEYINTGGIYFQLALWDRAIEQFQIAVNLKQDYANAYYNLGHALEEKGDLQTALAQYQTVRSLVANDKTSLDKIDAEIKVLEEKIGQAGGTQPQAQAAENQPPIEVNQPATQLPEQKPPVKIPAPIDTPTPTPTPSGEVSPSPAITP
ncbi:MAG: hypothetical protein COU25_01565 [Candidatus Levybacteria bacterium CG10_big_fil_rev_8_21_14_0_10_35_13]|nr:MAG: hypothetical protein COU25_01565 [Candidatus Levybacteria bacterium CG10_big_fil_rev_8_21_14_0_10_35_13]